MGAFSVTLVTYLNEILSDTIKINVMIIAPKPPLAKINTEKNISRPNSLSIKSDNNSLIENKLQHALFAQDNGGGPCSLESAMIYSDEESTYEIPTCFFSIAD